MHDDRIHGLEENDHEWPATRLDNVRVSVQSMGLHLSAWNERLVPPATWCTTSIAFRAHSVTYELLIPAIHSYYHSTKVPGSNNSIIISTYLVNNFSHEPYNTTSVLPHLPGTILNRTYGLNKKIYISVFLLLRGTLVNRSYGVHKNLYIKPFLLTIFGPVNPFRTAVPFWGHTT